VKFGYEIDDKEHNNPVDIEAGALGQAAREWISTVFSGHSHSWEDLQSLKNTGTGLLCSMEYKRWQIREDVLRPEFKELW
jgi:hypothetical protein